MRAFRAALVAALGTLGLIACGGGDADGPALDRAAFGRQAGTACKEAFRRVDRHDAAILARKLDAAHHRIAALRVADTLKDDVSALLASQRKELDAVRRLAGAAGASATRQAALAGDIDLQIRLGQPARHALGVRGCIATTHLVDDAVLAVYAGKARTAVQHRRSALRGHDPMPSAKTVPALRTELDALGPVACGFSGEWDAADAPSRLAHLSGRISEEAMAVCSALYEARQNLHVHRAVSATAGPLREVRRELPRLTRDLAALLKRLPAPPHPGLNPTS